MYKHSLIITSVYSPYFDLYFISPSCNLIISLERETPIPFYAKPVEATEETAQYTDREGNYYNILGAQFIYGDDISTYGMFTCLDDAAANMRLTKIERDK